jgi:two-component system CheB/CheR fusion protein
MEGMSISDPVFVASVKLASENVMPRSVPRTRNRPPPKRVSGIPQASNQPEPTSPVGNTPQNFFLIVGIGASAGGFGAFMTLLQNLPADTGAAFVLIQHLSPTHESILPALLARSTRMPVGEAHDGARIEPDHVYVIPSQMDLVITDGHLKLLPRAAPPGRMPIDLFFRSLAEVQGEKAIGVVLSGSASDGTLGLKAIKAAGGICLAQDPQSASYEGMPLSAIAAGCIDAVLPPGEIAREIARLANGTYLRQPRPATAQDVVPYPERSGLDAIFALLKKMTGNDVTGYKKATLLRRIQRRMALSHLEDLAEYARHLEGNPAEIHELYQDLLIHVTSFFRNPETFAALALDVFPRLVRDRSTGASLRIWVPGCSTGEEAYSIAICLLESLDGLGINPHIQIFGTDLHESVVAKARTGLYLESITADVAPERLERFFSRVNGYFQISKTVRNLCVFARHDLIRDPPFSRLDLISCRNVLIYLEPKVKRGVMANFHYALNPHGLLILGSSETIVASSDLFLPVNLEHRIYAPQPHIPRPGPSS